MERVSADVWGVLIGVAMFAAGTVLLVSVVVTLGGATVRRGLADASDRRHLQFGTPESRELAGEGTGIPSLASESGGSRAGHARPLREHIAM
jgi:hypothetical protein